MAECGFAELPWAIKPSKNNGIPTLYIDTLAILSAYDPQIAANRLAQQTLESVKTTKADHIIIIGMGLGYFPKALFTQGFEKIIVWDPFPEMQNSITLQPGELAKSSTSCLFFRRISETCLQICYPWIESSYCCPSWLFIIYSFRA